MPVYLAPGVYVEETPSKMKTIPGVGAVGYDERIGPLLDRPRYLNGRMLTAKDFTDEQNYGREKLRRHNRVLHGCGVVCGLAVAADDSPTAPWGVRVGAGLALDRYGNELVVTAPVVIDVASYHPHDARQLYLGVRYAESLLRDGTERLLPDDGSRDDDDAMCGDPRATTDAIREAVIIGFLPHPPADPWIALAAITLPPSRRTRLTDADIENVGVRLTPHVTPSQ